MTNTANDAREKLLKDMKRTKGVRFNASKRVEENEKKSTRNTAYASAAVVVITLLPVFFPMNQFANNAIALTTVGLSIFILASSLLQSANAGLVKADQFQRCALEVNSLRRELIAAPADDDISAYSIRYDEILRRYNINHDQVDYDRYRLEHPEEFPSLAPEETAAARINLKREDNFENRISRAILIVTVTSATVAFSASSVSISKFIEGILAYFGPAYK